MYTEEIKQLALKYHEEMIRWRRHLHQYPELGFEEVETGRYLAEALTALGYQVTEGIAKTGVVGLLQGEGAAGKVVAIRADMDALPVTELSEVAYASRHPGKMHACGHDTHMAMVLGAAAVLASLKASLKGSIKIIFQPAEEGPGGAIPMIAAGVLENPAVDYILGGHAWPGIPVGQIALQAGPMMASSTGFNITIRGRGGHGAEPHKCIDAVALGAQVVVALQQIISRTNDPQEPAVVTVGQFNAGTRSNIIAETAELRGTLRTFNTANRDRILDLIQKVASGVCEPYGAVADMGPRRSAGLDVTANDAALTARVLTSAEAILGESNVITKFKPSMGGEDFCYFAHKIPGCYIFIGVTGESQGTYPIHHNRFDIDEEALRYGAMLFAQAAVDLLL
ncbi:MAG: M20 family metallopeptidase [Symbiobacteriaceae bacterium]|nr:M20 family metallopeptidase [Symbiobacteriaceae bacterium]